VPRLSEVRIRDPFILSFDDRYYLYGTTDPQPWSGPGIGFDCYVSDDLVTWHGPNAVFRPPAEFWGLTQFWAPEVYPWDSAFVMLATFADGEGRRGTQVLRSGSPEGPFVPWSDGPLTPESWMCLDGTLHVDGSGDPWLVFCHEWLQIGDGAIYARRLSEDLRRAVGEPIRLFSASEAPWTHRLSNSDTGYHDAAYVTDGPFLVRSDGGTLWLFWSSGSGNGYAIGVARSSTGEVTGPWLHESTPVWDQDGGHSMVVRSRGRDLLLLHHPNRVPLERAILVPVVIGDSDVIVQHADGTPVDVVP